MAAGSEFLSFGDKKTFFEKEIAEQTSVAPRSHQERKFSYLQEHEVLKLRTEEERKANLMSAEELRKLYLEQSSTSNNTTDYDKALARSHSNNVVCRKGVQRRIRCNSLATDSHSVCSPDVALLRLTADDSSCREMIATRKSQQIRTTSQTVKPDIISKANPAPPPDLLSTCWRKEAPSGEISSIIIENISHK